MVLSGGRPHYVRWLPSENGHFSEAKLVSNIKNYGAQWCSIDN